MNFNKNISISSIIILYEFLILLLLLLNIISKNRASNLLSPLIILNFFIIFVMFLTNCKIDNIVKLSVVSVKLILLIIILTLVKFNCKNYFIGVFILFIYFIFSDIETVYSCKIKINNLIKSLMYSTLIFLFLTIYQHSSAIIKN
jgi:hypothetical protein